MTQRIQHWNMDFDNIAYLQSGNDRQQEAYLTLTNSQVLLKLKAFDPILVGTIPINIDIENSDLDIICYFENKEDFLKAISDNFGNEQHFKIREQQGSNKAAVVANFLIANFEIEIFGQNIPTKEQFAYRHLIVEYNLLNKFGEEFRQEIIELKKQGIKTEPAFAKILGLTGDPYVELLKFEIAG